jgi:hypothetical protein
MAAAWMYGLKFLIWVVFFIAFLGLQPVERRRDGLANLPLSIQSYIENQLILENLFL